MNSLLNSTTAQLGVRDLLILSVKAVFLLHYSSQFTKYVLIWSSQHNCKGKTKKKADTIIPYFTDKQNEAQKGYQIRIRLQS